jgi:hypothetical protein
MHRIKSQNLEEIKRSILIIAKIISAPDDALPLFGESKSIGEFHIEVHGPSLEFIASDQGLETVHLSTFDSDELYYWVFKDVTWKMAYEKIIPGQSSSDQRRAFFNNQLQLLKQINVDWYERRKKEIDEILINNPYLDGKD